jgi:hypothetical protein
MIRVAEISSWFANAFGRGYVGTLHSLCFRSRVIMSHDRTGPNYLGSRGNIDTMVLMSFLNQSIPPTDANYVPCYAFRVDRQ